jgi:hypothetical protein
MLKLSFFAIILLLGIDCHAQKKKNTIDFKGYKILTLSNFNTLVDTCTSILETKKFSDISDSDNINIIKCSNTIFYSHVIIANDTIAFLHGKRRFEGGRYARFDSAIDVNNAYYDREMSKKYKWAMSSGLGLYFEKLKIQAGGRVERRDVFKVLNEEEIRFLLALQCLQCSLFF